MLLVDTSRGGIECCSEDRKITKEAFIRNNKGISSEGDLPDEFLAAIYDRIAASPISLKVPCICLPRFWGARMWRAQRLFNHDACDSLPRSYRRMRTSGIV